MVTPNKLKGRDHLAIRVLALMSAGVFGLVACTSGSNTRSGGGTVTIRMLLGDYDNLNPATAASFGSYEMAYMLYDRLVSVSPTGKLVPYLATSWESTPNSATLHVRSDAKCADGTIITPSMVKASLDYLAAPSTGAFPATLTFGQGAPPSITADDSAKTVHIQLTTPYPDLMLSLAQASSSIICPAGLKDPSALAEHVFGSGPYVLTDSRRGDTYTLTKRTGFAWGPADSDISAMPDQVVFKVIGSESTAANLLISGGLDIAAVTGRDVERLRKQSSLKATLDDLYGANALVFNESPGLPGADPQIRKALALAINSKDYNQAANFGFTKTIDTLYTPGMECYSADDGTSNTGYDPTAAKEILRADGWISGAGGYLYKNGQELTVRVVANTSLNAGPEYMQSAFAAIGVNAKVSVTDNATYLNTTFVTGQWDVQDYAYGGPFPEPPFIAVQASGAAPPNGVNVGFVDNEGYNSEVGIASTQAVPQSCQAWQEAERLLLERVDAKPLWLATLFWFSKNGATFSPILAIGIDPFSLRAA